MWQLARSGLLIIVMNGIQFSIIALLIILLPANKHVPLASRSPGYEEYCNRISTEKMSYGDSIQQKSCYPKAPVGKVKPSSSWITRVII